MAVAPMKYAERAALGMHLIDEDHDLLVDMQRGFTPSGTFLGAETYKIVYDGVEFYSAVNAFQTVYGGSGDIGGIDGHSFEDVFHAAIANGGKICIAIQGTVTVAGSGAQGANNGAALIINNNTTNAALEVYGLGMGITTLKIDDNSAYNVMEVTNNPQDLVNYTPAFVAIHDLTFDGNQANNAQLVAGDRYQNAFYAENIRNFYAWNIECINAAYHGCCLNSLQNSKVSAICHDNNNDGFLATGPFGIGLYNIGCDFHAICYDNGPVAQTFDTTYCGAIFIACKGCNITSITHDNGLTDNSNGIGSCFNEMSDCIVHAESRNEKYNAFDLREGLIHNELWLTAEAPYFKGMIDDGGNPANPIAENTIHFNCKNAGHETIVIGGTNGYCNNNVFSGVWLNSLTGTALIQLGVRARDNLFTNFQAGDDQAIVTTACITQALSGENGNVFRNGRVLPTSLTPFFRSDSVPGFFGNDSYAEQVDGYNPIGNAVSPWDNTNFIVGYRTATLGADPDASQDYTVVDPGTLYVWGGTDVALTIDSIAVGTTVDATTPTVIPLRPGQTVNFGAYSAAPSTKYILS